MSQTTTWQVVVFPVQRRDNRDMRHAPTPFEHDVVVRRIDRPLATLQLPDTTTVGALRITGPFSDDPAALAPAARAPGVLGRTRVAVEVGTWSDRTSELRVIPRTRHLHLWGERRQRRYFARAHRAADDLVHLVA
ncbi:MAG: hypothetical protein QOG87_264 [Actinomycetota bacterium]|jgi:hypothetical protein